MRTWTSGRDGPPARDTSIPPPTVGKACLPPSPAHLIITTAQVRHEALEGDEESGQCGHSASVGCRANRHFPKPVATRVTSEPD